MIVIEMINLENSQNLSFAIISYVPDIPKTNVSKTL